MEPIIDELELARENYEQEAGRLLEIAKTIAITDRKTMLDATDFLKRVLSLKEKVNEKFNPIIKKAHEAHKMTIALRGEILAPFLLAESTVRPKINSFLEEEEKKRQAEEEAMRKDTSDIGLPMPDLPRPAFPEGVHIRKNLKIKVVDLMALCKAVADGRIPLPAVCADESYIRRVADRVGPENLNYPGVTAYYEKGLVVRDLS